MNREERAVAISGLIFFMFGLSIFLKDGSFVVPFPLNEFALLIVSFLFMIWHPKKGALPYLFFISALSGVLGSMVFWETVMSGADLVKFYQDYTVIDLARLSQGVFLVVSMYLFFSAYREWYFKAMIVLAIAMYIWGFIPHSVHYMALSFLVLMLVGILKPMKKPFHLMWVLHFLLFAMAWITIHFA